MTLEDRRGLERDVYQPAEDSHVLAEAVCESLEATDGEFVLEVGTGSGYVAATIAEATPARVIATDLNPHAVSQASEAGLEVVRADLVTPFADSVFTAVAFNPPYLPTDPDNEWDDWMEQALSGGEDGRALIDPFLETVGRVLAPDGRVYLLVSSLTGYEDVLTFAERQGFSHRVVAEESFPFETLSVLELELTG